MTQTIRDHENRHPRLEVLVYHPELLDTYMDIVTSARPDITYYPCRSTGEIERHIDDIQAIFAPTAFPGELLRRASQLKWVQIMGAGADRYTLAGAIPDGVTVTRVRGTFAPRIAEYVLAHMLAITQRLRQAAELQKNHQWESYVPDILSEKALGVCGLGVIGREVARKAAFIGMRVVGLDAAVGTSEGVVQCFRPGQEREFVSGVDFLVLTLPLTRQTLGLVNFDILKHMKASAYLINACRGRVVVESDLIRVLKEGRLAGAVLDVVEKEPLDPSSELWDLPGVTITPHMSGFSYPHECTEAFLQNLARFERGEPLADVIDVVKGY